MSNSAFSFPPPPNTEWEKISTLTAATTSTFAFTGLTNAFSTYVIIASNLLASAISTTNIVMRTSSNNGVSYDSGAGNYGWACEFFVGNSGTVSADNTSDTSIQLNTQNVYTMYNVAGYTQQAYITISNPSLASFCNISSTITGFCYYSGGGGGLFNAAYNANGARLANAPVNAIQISTTAGTLASGTFILYGII